jgi:MFS family permease
MLPRIKSKNISFGYLLVFLNNSFFWYAPWLLFLLRYLSLQQATVVQAIGMATTVFSEIPTGALSDLIGKKKTLQLAFIITTIGEIMTAFSREFWQFAITFIILNIGYSFYSGTMEAYMYDTLVSSKDESKYPKVVSKMQAVENGAIAIASITGGFMYRFIPFLPFLATGLFKIFALIATFFIQEPEVDTDDFSFVNFWKQTQKGFKHLFQKSMLKYTSLLFVYGTFFVLAYEILTDAAVIDWGYDEIGIGFLYAAATFIAIPSSFLYERFSKRFKPLSLILVGISILIINFLFSPWINIWVWTAIFLIRVFYSPIKNSAISELLNKRTSSKIRATTLSTYQLLRKAPFLLLSAPIGWMMMNYGVKNFSLLFAVTLFIITAGWLVLVNFRKSK